MHISVLLQETVRSLALTGDSTVIDATLGAGGHANEILKQLGPKGTLVAIDADPTALASVKLVPSKAKIVLINDNFRNIKQLVLDNSLEPDAIIADLGWRTDQFESGGKGFSFNSDDPLLMTFGDPETHLFTADDVVNEWAEESLRDIISGYGEERFAGRIAKAIVRERAEGRITTARQLADIVASSVPKFGYTKIHPATRTFQAIRIAVNDELGALKQFLTDGFECLRPEGRLAVISFHSLEDRIVKRFFNEMVKEGRALKLNKKPIIAKEDELERNPRARSAKLRVLEKN